MGDNTAIGWTNATWNPIAGCSIVSAGCTNCYAMNVAGSRTSQTAKYKGLTKGTKRQPVWTGEVRFWERALLDPLRWTKPRRIFVNSMSDLFHENVPDEWIDRIFAVMALAPQHTFQVLTKRPERMRAYVAQIAADDLDRKAFFAGCGLLAREIERVRSGGLKATLAMDVLSDHASGPTPWPLPNVWLGVSAENQATADERIPILLDTPAAIRWVSAEPLLGRIDLEDIRDPKHFPGLIRKDVLRGHAHHEDDGGQWTAMSKLDWVVVGGESGRHARPMHPDWVRSLRDQCAEAGVPFFFKQWGEWAPRHDLAANQPGIAGRLWHTFDPDASVCRVGKAAAGNLLDGKIHEEWPATPSVIGAAA